MGMGRVIGELVPLSVFLSAQAISFFCSSIRGNGISFVVVVERTKSCEVERVNPRTIFLTLPWENQKTRKESQCTIFSIVLLSLFFLPLQIHFRWNQGTPY